MSYPNDATRKWWDLMVVFLLMYVGITVPLHIGALPPRYAPRHPVGGAPELQDACAGPTAPINSTGEAAVAIFRRSRGGWRRGSRTRQ